MCYKKNREVKNQCLFVTISSTYAFLNYSDISDYEFIVSENKADYDFAAGFHLFGSPIGLDENDFYSIISKNFEFEDNELEKK